MEYKLDGAYVKYEGNALEVSTGIVSRKWEWRGNGFATTELSSDKYGVEYKGSGDCDYNIFGLSSGSKAKLFMVDAHSSVNINTSNHIEVDVITAYPELSLCVKYVIWVYPGSSGLRTQLFVKAVNGYTPALACGDSIAEAFMFPKVSRIKAVGYYNDTQHRNTPETEIIREKDLADPEELRIDWANLIALFDNNGSGICVVKESNKCVNQPSYETGVFIYKNNVLTSTGIGLMPNDIMEGQYLFAWASWMIFFNDGDNGFETAIKTFDRFRFPINPEHDIYIMSNTWGTGNAKLPGDDACAERVLKDIAVAAEIGVDVQQVDAGWNSPMGTQGIPADLPWYTHETKYPDGWKTIRDPARKLGLKLGLWFSWKASTDEIIDNMRSGDFRYFKIDYASLDTRKQLDMLYNKALKLFAASNGSIRINWDVTENAARMGYYFGREFGNIYLENRKPCFPPNVVYIPHLVLRDAWQVAKYTNINKFQVTLQNLDLVSRKTSDAYQHNFSYCAMISFMGSPILFQQVQFLSTKARQELQVIIAVYKRHREAMYRCLVYPIGNKPDNCSWTGFQFVNDEHGYIIVFRELNNKNDREKIKLKFIACCDLPVTDVISGAKKTIAIDHDGYATFAITNPCGFSWLVY